MSAHELGRQSMLDVINNRQGIAAHLNDLSENPEMLAGAVSGLLAIYSQIHAMGVIAKHEEPALDAFLQSGDNVMAAMLTIKTKAYDRPWLNKHLGAMVNAVAEHRMGWIFSLGQPQSPQAPAPLEMRIVGMPERVTESTVTYDQKGDIKATKQTEKDAA